MKVQAGVVGFDQDGLVVGRATGVSLGRCLDLLQVVDDVAVRGGGQGGHRVPDVPGRARFQAAVVVHAEDGVHCVADERQAGTDEGKGVEVVYILNSY